MKELLHAVTQRAGLLVLLALLVPLNATAQQEYGPTIVPLEPSTQPIHLRVQFEEHPQSEAVISWSTTARGRLHTLYIDTEPRHGDTETYTRQITDIRSGPFTLRSNEQEMAAWYHHAYLNDLQPGTRYYITVQSGDHILGEYHFYTAPAEDRTVALLAGGDSRVQDSRVSPDNNRRRMNARMSLLLQEHPHIVALAHTADYTNRPHWSEYYYWLNDHFETTTTPDGRLLPVIPSRGNHDMGVVFEETFWWPNRQNDFYYLIRLTPEVLVVVLNTEISISGRQRDWLEQSLQREADNYRYVNAMFHKPLYPSVRAYSGSEGRRRAWAPLLEQYGVSLVMVGHDHALKRTVPIRDEQPSDQGIVYIGDGGLGVPVRQVDPDRWYLRLPGMTRSIDNVHFIEYSQEHIYLRAVGREGQTLDEFMIPADRETRRAHYRALLDQ